MHTYGGYWRLSHLHLYESLVGVSSPILLTKGSRCHHLMTLFNKLLDVKTVEVFGGMYLVNVKAAISSDDEYRLMCEESSVEISPEPQGKLKNSDLWWLHWGKDLDFLKYLHSVESTENDWDKVEAEELASDLRCIKYRRGYLFRALKLLPLWPFSKEFRRQIRDDLDHSEFFESSRRKHAKLVLGEELTASLPPEFYNPRKSRERAAANRQRDREQWRQRKREHLRCQEEERLEDIAIYEELKAGAERGAFPAYFLCQ